jgi:hypothetical protein
MGFQPLEYLLVSSFAVKASKERKKPVLTLLKPGIHRSANIEADENRSKLSK